MKVKDAIEMLKKFNQEDELIMRVNHENGYFADHYPIFKDDFFPAGDVQIILGLPRDCASEQKENNESK